VHYSCTLGRLGSAASSTFATLGESLSVDPCLAVPAGYPGLYTLLNL